MAEVLVALALVTVLTGSALALALSSRGVYTTDLNRTTLNQNLRIGMDLVGVDVRQAGQQLPDDVPAIEVINGDAGAPDQLILRRNVIGTVMPLCKDIAAGSAADALFVARKEKKPPLGCSPVEDTDGDKWPDNLQVWRNYRLNNGGEVLAFIYNPTREQYEFFLYDDEDRSTFHLHKANDDLWTNTYNVDEGSRIYILEQKTYQVTEDLLEYFINGDEADVRKLIYNVTDFQVFARMSDGTRLEALGVSDEWSKIESLEIELEVQTQFQNRTMTRRLNTRFFPRNVQSV